VDTSRFNSRLRAAGFITGLMTCSLLLLPAPPALASTAVRKSASLSTRSHLQYVTSPLTPNYVAIASSRCTFFPRRAGRLQQVMVHCKPRLPQVWLQRPVSISQV